MRNLLTSAFCILTVILSVSCSSGEKTGIYSPDGSIRFEVYPSKQDKINTIAGFKLFKGNKVILLPSSVLIKIKEVEPTCSLKIIGIETDSISSQWINNFGERKNVPDKYNQVKISMECNNLKLNLLCRAYNEGVAIAYEFPKQKGADSLTILKENFIFRFPADYTAWSAEKAQAQYNRVPLSKIVKGCERPLVIEYDSSLIIAIAEAKLVDYARMKFDPDSLNGISIRSKLDGEVKRSLPFQSPWRVIMIGKNPGDLLEKNYLILNLNDPSAISDLSWIKPGKALREVTLTTAGAKAAINFTSAHNMQYVEFDAGWYGPENKDESDARAVNLDPARSKGPFDIKEVTDYAKARNIGVLLYVNRKAAEKQLDELLPIYKQWGVAGIKFGFVQVGSQKATAWLHESIKKVTEYKMIADVHDEYRPTGFARTYPNWLTQEGIRGDEESPTNSHTLITMFTRMLAGQGDNTICYYNDRVDKKMGSHASQLAKSVCLFSPLQFIYWYDKASPSLEKKDGLWGTTNYIGDEPELEFFDNVPTVWDETKVLYAKIGEFGVIARKKGDEWFVGGINGEVARTLQLMFDFLDSGIEYSAKIYTDDPGVTTRTHVRIDSISVRSNDVYQAKLASNNGIAIHIKPLK